MESLVAILPRVLKLFKLRPSKMDKSLKKEKK